jgi:hypothetical protein
LFSVVLNVQGVNATEILSVHDDTDFLVGFPDHSVHNGLTGFHLARRSVPTAVTVAAATLGEQDVAVPHEQQVHVQDHTLTHVTPLPLRRGHRWQRLPGVGVAFGFGSRARRQRCG